MSPTITAAAARRRTCLLASSFLAAVLCLGLSAAKAQQGSPDPLPPIEVSPPEDQNRTRAKPIGGEGSGSRRVTPNIPPTRSTNVAPTSAPPTNATAIRQFNGIVGASTSVITSEDIARSPAQTVQEIIAQTPGVQLTSLFGGVNGVGSTSMLGGTVAFETANSVDMRNG